jgi:hypothetical protein
MRDIAQEDIRHSGRMQQASSLRSPEQIGRGDRGSRRRLDRAALLHYQSP